MADSAVPLKDQVREFWDDASCGEVYAVGSELAERMAAQSRARYELEPYLPPFAGFRDGVGRRVLEVGIGMGADHLEWAGSDPERLIGIDFTPRAVGWTAQRLAAAGYTPRVAVADAEALPFPTDAFDLVYSWGVLHHTPDTARAVGEIHRVLRPGGQARMMIYHSRSIVGYLLWIRYALLAGRPKRSLADVYAAHLESPGTKAFTTEEARELLRPFGRSEVWTRLSFGDLLQGAAGQRHRGLLLSAARRAFPRKLIARLLPDHGLVLLMRAVK